MGKKVFIAIPCMDQVPVQFCQSLAMLEKAGPTVIGFQVGSLVYTSRNSLAVQAIDHEADYIFWLDSDMVFPSGTLRHMLNTIEQQPEETILSGVYYRRNPPYSPVAFEKLSIDDNGCATWADLERVPDKLFDAEGVGFGCVLMPTRVMVDVQANFGALFDPIGGTGEDLSFCWRARQCGWKIVCDPRIQLGHVGHTIITGSFWENYRAYKAQEEQHE